MDSVQGVGLRLEQLNPDMPVYETFRHIQLEKEAERREIAERKRLMYVAFTRARDRTVPGEHGKAVFFKPKPEKSRMDDWIGSALNISAEVMESGRVEIAVDNGDRLVVECVTSYSCPLNRGSMNTFHWMKRSRSYRLVHQWS